MSHILLLEPNTLLGKTYTKAFTYAGHTAAYQTDAQGAIFAADTQRPDLIVLELLLPNHNGIEFLHELRSYPDWQHIPVVVHTALPAARLAPVAEVLQRDLGVETILYKPQTSLQSLLQAAADALQAT
ncbi:MAG TPA: response regulator [Candidatus Saccharimonadales bacterium]|nr:response regulator [Candidatus Saccharimonadales bacterium]